MRKNFRVVKASFIMAVLLLSVLTVITPLMDPGKGTVSALRRNKIITFPSYIEINYDSSELNKDLSIDKSINIPINITYRTDIPGTFGRLLPWQIRNIILFGSMIVPMQKIHIEVLDAPDWADIELTQADVFVNIPTDADPPEVAETSLVISPREEAPAVPQSIVLKATSLEIGRVQITERERGVFFTPSFIPTITINPEKPTRTVSPRSTVNFKIYVSNNGNKKIRVTPESVNIDSKWTPTINPPFQDIQAGGNGEFIFSIYAPYDFGWHNEIQSFQIDFTAKIFPLRDDAPVGGPYSIYLRVNNYGFSTPGFEIVVLFAAIIIVGLILKKRQSIKKEK